MSHSELELECTQVLWHLTAFRQLEADEVGVDEGHDGQRHARFRQVGAASASIVAKLAHQVVIVRDVRSVAGRLDGTHHKLVFSRELLDNTLLLLGVLDGSDWDLGHVELHVVDPFLGGQSFGASGG